MGSGIGASTSDFERVRHADNPALEAGNVIAERAGNAADAIGKQADAAMQKASTAVTAAKERGGQAVDQASNVVGNFREAVETSAKTQPVTTVLMALAAGFIVGAIWRGPSNS